MRQQGAGARAVAGFFQLPGAIQGVGAVEV